MVPIYLSNISISSLRHLQNLNITIPNNEFKHLILTGKNGSGKSTILNEIKYHLLARTQNWYGQSQEAGGALNQYRNIYNSNLSNIRNHNISGIGGIVNENIYASDYAFIDMYRKQANNALQMIQFLENFLLYTPKRAEIYFENQEHIMNEFRSGLFITSYYDAKRSTTVGAPAGIVPLQFRNSYSVNSNISTNFLQHIVNLRAEQSFANDENDIATRNSISDWFENFQQQLRFIFDDDSLILIFNRKQFDFSISVNNNNFDFNSLSEGFSAVLSIVTDLMLRSDKKDPNEYSGIVLIDEIETHLHIDLQKKILLFLTRLFPKIQFIVTTHSPFILNSIENTVIYDVERKTTFEDFSSFSSESIVEGYFKQDKYSEVVKLKVDRFEELFKKNNRSEVEEDELDFLKDHLEELPKFYSKELALKIEQIKLTALYD